MPIECVRLVLVVVLIVVLMLVLMCEVGAESTAFVMKIGHRHVHHLCLHLCFIPLHFEILARQKIRFPVAAPGALDQTTPSISSPRANSVRKGEGTTKNG